MASNFTPGSPPYVAGEKPSLGVLRGKLLTLRSWSEDTAPHLVETGVFMLSELRAGRVRDIVEFFDDDWPGECAALAAGFARIGDHWATASPDDRRRQVDQLLAVVNSWDQELAR